MNTLDINIKVAQIVTHFNGRENYYREKSSTHHRDAENASASNATI